MASALNIARLQALGYLLALCLLLMTSCSSAGVAQQPAIPDAPSVTKQHQEEEEAQKKEQSQRILGIIPMFDVTDREDAPPLSNKQKFRLFVRGTLDPFELVTVGISAGVSHANNDFPEYGEGAAGFGKRFGAGLADGVSAGLFGAFVYPVVFHQDPRYFRSGEGPATRRVIHALGQEFVCHTDSGRQNFNFSKVLGALTASGISNVYYPPADRGFGATMNRTGIALINGSVGGLLDEFWPDIRRKVFHKQD